MVIYVWLNVKALKRLCTFRTKICDRIQNYARDEKNQPHQEVEDGNIFVNKLMPARRWTQTSDFGIP